ncbi:MAG: hypothetical protein U0168_09455 [Nannocystaceae bacterium]
MPGDGGFRFVVAGEDRGHHAVVRALARRCLGDAIAWFADIDHDSDDRWHFEAITRAHQQAKTRGLKLHGKFGAEPAKPDAHMVRAQLALWALDDWPFDFAVVARDTDGQPARLDGARQALRDHPPRKPVVLAYAEPEVEAWVIAGWDPRDEAEQRRLDHVVARLSFDPRRSPDRLTAKRQSDPRDAKAVLGELCGGSETEAHWARCTDAPTERWREHTTNVGGPSFLDGLLHEVVPALLRLTAAARSS